MSFSVANMSTKAHNGAKVVLWANATFPPSVDWYGLGMNATALFSNAGTSSKHSFHVLGT